MTKASSLRWAIIGVLAAGIPCTRAASLSCDTARIALPNR